MIIKDERNSHNQLWRICQRRRACAVQSRARSHVLSNQYKTVLTPQTLLSSLFHLLHLLHLLRLVCRVPPQEFSDTIWSRFDIRLLFVFSITLLCGGVDEEPGNTPMSFIHVNVSLTPPRRPEGPERLVGFRHESRNQM